MPIYTNRYDSKCQLSIKYMYEYYDLRQDLTGFLLRYLENSAKKRRLTYEKVPGASNGQTRLRFEQWAANS